MERKKLMAALLTIVMTVGAVIAYRTLTSRDSLFDLQAEKQVYSRTLGVSQGPGPGKPKMGMLQNAISTCYYSTNSDLNDTSFLVLSATDAKTPGIFMNLTVINGLLFVTVTFSGGPLYAMATPTLFEDYTPDPEGINTLTSGIKKSFSGFPDAGGANIWMQSYIGNDNFDPIGGVNLLGRTDTYTGRFFTNFASSDGGVSWGFQDPDETTVVGDATTTLREAYEAINLPFFNVRFVVNLNSYSVYINNFKVYEENEAFYLKANYTDQTYCLETFELQAVNYGDGIDTDGEDPDTIATPLPSYFVAYTNPIVRQVVA